MFLPHGPLQKEEVTMNPLRSILRLALSTFTAAAVGSSPFLATESDAACQLNSAGGNIKRVVYIIFDNTHFRRDNPNVPSDLEQMPNLLNFIRNNGTLMTYDHTILISHTAGGILSNLTGVYPDRHGQAVSNSYRYFLPNGSTLSSSSFKYWTDLVDDTGNPPADPLPNMVNGDSGSPKTMPAPWVPYTRAGCDFGSAGGPANIVLENTGTGPNGDMTKVFGVNSAEWNEAVASNAAPPNTAARNLAQTDFIGFAIHCGAGGGICAGNQNARPDQLPDEPGGYNGFLGLFGAKYVNPAINGGSAGMNNLNGQPITDQFGQLGFPGFDGLFATTTLAYIAQMQEAGIPVTFGYISDAHDQHGIAGEIHATRGPGEADYVQQLKDYDVAFGKFFDRLAASGITKNNTLFVFTVEEGDHFAGSSPTPAGCNGVTVPCTYSLVGEINGNLTGLLATQQGITTPFTVHSDMAPTIYITGNPARTDAVTRNFGRALGALTTTNLYTNQSEKLAAALADPVGMGMLHMITADPQRTPTLTLFAQADYFLFTGAANCNSPCLTVPTTPPTSTFAWNHGGIQPEIANTWMGFAGPGVRALGQDDQTWLDHADVRPTMLSLLGLSDTYVHDGRVLFGNLEQNALPITLRGQSITIRDLADTYKQLNAPFGQLGQASLIISTAAVASNTPGDAAYTTLSNKLVSWRAQRDVLANKMRAVLDAAAFQNQAINEPRASQLVGLAQALINQVSLCAANVTSCAQ
jgi:arylsulfatase A-like enzyme